MRFLLLATDYDGTLATDGRVDAPTLAAMDRLRASGRKLVLVTGRHLPDLQTVFPKLELFDRVVVENGALLYRPATREEKLLCEGPHQKFVALLHDRNVPVAVGRCIVSTWQPHDVEVLEVIKDLGLDLQVIFNKGAVMVLPSGVNKGSGLKAALGDLGLSAHNVVSVGDAENDHSFLRISECAAAVANALPALKERADVVLDRPRGAGVTELVDRLIEDDLAEFDSRLQRHWISLGQRVSDSSEPVLFSPCGGGILVAGPSASGKSTAVAGILEQLLGHEYQFCLLDPEGDYDDFSGALSFGTAREPPDVKAILRALESPGQSVIVNLLGVPLDDRPGFSGSLLSSIQELRLRSARPHWLVMDEAHHLLPSSWSPMKPTVSHVLESAILITVHPEHVPRAALDHVNAVVAMGKDALKTIGAFSSATEIAPPQGEDVELDTGEALVWLRTSSEPPVQVKTARSTQERRRHVRLYAEGELSEQQSFYFRGPEAKLNLRAQNLKTFVQIAEGVDDATWIYHLRRGEYSAWFRLVIKDSELADLTSAIERGSDSCPQESREGIKKAIRERYTAPA